MSHRQINSHNIRMVLMSICYLTLAWAFTRSLGPVGFVLANCINMLFRISHSLMVIHSVFSKTQERPMKGMYPTFKTVVVLAGAGSICQYSERIVYPHRPLVHLAVGAVIFFITVGCILHEEKFMWQFVVDQWRKLRRKGEEKKKKED